LISTAFVEQSLTTASTISFSHGHDVMLDDAPRDDVCSAAPAATPAALNSKIAASVNRCVNDMGLGSA